MNLEAKFENEPIPVGGGRKDSIRWKFMPNGNIRFFQDTPDKRGVSEMQINNPKNEAMTVTTAHTPKTIAYAES